MSKIEWQLVLSGAIAMGFAVAGLFFLRYWKESRDRFFIWFGLALFVLAGNRIELVLLGDARESTLVPYLVRLVAFLIFLSAVVDKNLRRTRPPP